MVAHEVGKRLAGNLLNDVALDVHGEAVAPFGAGLVVERDLREAVDHLLEGGGVPDIQFLVQIVDRAVAIAVAETGGVGHQLVHGGRVVGLDDEDHFAGDPDQGSAKNGAAVSRGPWD